MLDTLFWFAKHLGLSGEAVVPLLLWLVLFLSFVRVIGGKDNPIQFWHFFSSYNERSGRDYGDINNLGMMAGIMACLFTIMWIVYKTGDINPWILGVCLIYLGGVKAFASWLRMVAAKRYSVPVATDPPAPPAPPAPEPATHEVTRSLVEKTTTKDKK